jgi:hypothetical protein
VAKPIFEIDNRFETLEGFFAEFRVKTGASSPQRSFDAFNDVLRGDFGTPEGGFLLRWVDWQRSKRLLGSQFDVLVEIIRGHGPGGDEAEDGVELELV